MGLTGVKGRCHTRLQCQGGSGQFLSVRWHSLLQALTAKHVLYPQLTATYGIGLQWEFRVPVMENLIPASMV